MGLFGSIVNALSSGAGMGSSSLKSAYLDNKAPKGPGVYKLTHDGQLMKVGKAGDGLRKRLSDYYRGLEGGTAGLKYITKGNRDNVFVSWVECSPEKARALEIQWYDQAKSRGEKLPWSDRR